jgi:diguanylate cyclase (GGDEF)-like protein/PAS domain S-box-containing protein
VESYLRSAFEDAPIGIALVGLGPEDTGRFLRVNRSLCMLTGCSVAQLESHVLWDLLHPDDVGPDRIAMARLTAGDSEGFELEQRVIHQGGQVVWVMVNASLVRDRCGRPLYCIRQVQDIEERKRYEGELGYLVEHDSLTGLLSRRGFVRALSQEIAEVRRYGGTASVLFLDIDDFKNVNDTLGHSVGDEMLSEVARIVLERLRETDVLARLGGDEFAVLLPRAAEADALSLAHSVLDAVRTAELTSLGGGRRVSVSVGLTTLKEPPMELTADDILVEADLAMYTAKEGGKDRVAVASDANQERMRSRVTWAQRVRDALGDDRFQLHCQPIIELGTDTITQYELLLRLPGTDGELILPAQFLYTAERSGTILDIDRWVLRTAIGLIAEHHHAGRHLRLHVNLSGRSVSEAELPAFIEQHLDDAGIDPASLVLEVTETAAIANMDRARQFATRLTAIGCLFALDDFGAGFGSFYYLKHFPFDYIKIDGEFVQHLPASSTDQLILDSIVRMCNGLGKQTIAEHAGDRETIEKLTEHGVDYAQGYHIGRPVPIISALAL